MAKISYSYSPAFAGAVALFGRGAEAKASRTLVLDQAARAAWRHIAVSGIGGVLVRASGTSAEAHAADCRAAFLALGGAASSGTSPAAVLTMQRRAALAEALDRLLACQASAKAEGRRPSAEEAESAVVEALAIYNTCLSQQAQAKVEATKAKAEAKAEATKAEEAKAKAEEAALIAHAKASAEAGATLADLLAVASEEEARLLGALAGKLRLARSQPVTAPAAPASPFGALLADAATAAKAKAKAKRQQRAEALAA